MKDHTETIKDQKIKLCRKVDKLRAKLTKVKWYVLTDIEDLSLQEKQDIMNNNNQIITQLNMVERSMKTIDDYYMEVK